MFKDIKKKAEEKATEAKEATSNIGNTVLDKAKTAKDSATDLATGAVKTASDAASSAGRMAKGAIDSVVITIATKIIVSSMKKAGKKGTSYISNDSKYQGFVDRTWELLPLPVRLIGKDTLGFNATMFLLRNSVFGKDEQEPEIDKKDEGIIKKTILSMFK
jgi:hypothetical protein|tara:strand:+ start:86 stop:568 length:483 start_codon:yes stop_codon:yes gene_type:complete